MSDLLLLLCNLQTSNVLFKLTFSDAVLILNVFQGDLGVFPQLSQLVLVLEHKMLQTLFVNFDFNLVFFLKILELTFFVTEFGLFVFQLFLSDKPEIVYTKALIIIEPNKVLFFFNEFFKVTTLNTQGLLELIVINIVNCISSCFRFLFSRLFLGRWWFFFCLVP